MHYTRHVAAFALAATLLACGTNSSTKTSRDGSADTGDQRDTDETSVPDTGPAMIDQIVLPPCTVRLGPDRPEMVIPAVATSADGAPMAADLSWESSDPSIVRVDEDGLVTAVAGLGTAEIVASADGIESLPVLVTVAPLVDGAEVIIDSSVVGLRYEAATPAGAPTLVTDVHTIVELDGVPAIAPGTPVVASGCLPIEGVVVDSETTDSGSWMAVRMASFSEVYAALDRTTVVYASTNDFELLDGLEEVFALERTDEELRITVRDPETVWTLQPPADASAAFADDEGPCTVNDGQVTCKAEIDLNEANETKIECTLSAKTELDSPRELLDHVRITRTVPHP